MRGGAAVPTSPFDRLRTGFKWQARSHRRYFSIISFIDIRPLKAV